MSQSELACVYASLILHDDDIEISEDNISKLLSAANVKVEPYWPSLFAKLFAKNGIGSLIANVGAGGGGGGAAAAAAPAAGGAAGGAAPAAAAAEKEEEKAESEEDEDMGFSLFD
ncbi:hypothetical protein WJX84_007306 [Apatococcus fuscideae]|uniref:60S acidic ribosomal protein P1 n=1 Tax=Apatococcus fuscideae TaxID=2026836 RepID=A0AAW1T508_9CHLO